MQRFDIRAHRILHRAGVLTDQLSRRLLGTDNRADGQAADDFLKVYAVDLCKQLGLGMTSRVQGQQDILLIHAGQRAECLAVRQTLLVEQVAVGAVAVDDGRAGQQLAERFAALQPVFDDFDRNTRGKQQLCQKIRNLTAADQHRRTDMVVGHAHLTEKVGLFSRRDDNRDIVALPQDKVALGDKSLSITAHHAHQHVAAQQGIDLADRHAVQPRALRDADIEQLDTPLGEGADIDRGREADQARNDARGRQLRVDDHGQAEFVADKADFGYIFRVAYARDRMAARRLAGDQAGKQVDLVVRGDRDQQVGIPHAGLLEHMVAGAAAGHRGQVEHVGQLGQPPLGQVDQGQLMSLGRELLGQRRADLAAAYNNDTHGAPPIFLFFFKSSNRPIKIRNRTLI